MFRDGIWPRVVAGIHALGLLVMAAPVLGQSKQTYVGVASNIPHAWFGVAAGTFQPEGTGLYADIKFSPPLGYPYEPLLREKTPSRGAVLVRRHDRWLSANLGITYSVFPRSFAYLAVGLTYHQRYRQYQDQSPALGDSFTYWLSDDRPQKYRPNLTAGVGYEMRSLVGFVGIDFAPRGLVLGLTYSL